MGIQCPSCPTESISTNQDFYRGFSPPRKSSRPFMAGVRIGRLESLFTKGKQTIGMSMRYQDRVDSTQAILGKPFQSGSQKVFTSIHDDGSCQSRNGMSRRNAPVAQSAKLTQIFHPS